MKQQANLLRSANCFLSFRRNAISAIMMFSLLLLELVRTSNGNPVGTSSLSTSEIIRVSTVQQEKTIYIILDLIENATFSGIFDAASVLVSVSSPSSVIQKTLVSSNRQQITIELSIVKNYADIVVNVFIAKKDFFTNQGIVLPEDFEDSLSFGTILFDYPRIDLSSEIEWLQTSIVMKIARILPAQLLLFNQIQGATVLILLDIYLPQRFYEICRFISTFIFQGIRPWQLSRSSILPATIESDFDSITDINTSSNLHLARIGIQESMLSEMVFPAVSLVALAWAVYYYFAVYRDSLRGQSIILNLISMYSKLLLLAFFVISFEQIRLCASVGSASSGISLILAIAFLAYIVCMVNVIFSRIRRTKDLQSNESKSNYLEIRSFSMWFFFGINEEASLAASNNYMRYFPFYSTLYKIWIAFVLVAMQQSRVYQISIIIFSELCIAVFRQRYNVLTSSRVVHVLKHLARFMFVVLLVLSLANHVIIDSYLNGLIESQGRADANLYQDPVPESVKDLDIAQIAFLIGYFVIHTVIKSIQCVNHTIEFFRGFNQYDSKNRQLIQKKHAKQIYEIFEEIRNNKDQTPKQEANDVLSPVKKRESSCSVGDHATRIGVLKQISLNESINRTYVAADFMPKQFFPGVPATYLKFDSNKSKQQIDKQQLTLKVKQTQQQVQQDSTQQKGAICSYDLQRQKQQNQQQQSPPPFVQKQQQLLQEQGRQGSGELLNQAKQNNPNEIKPKEFGLPVYASDKQQTFFDYYSPILEAGEKEGGAKKNENKKSFDRIATATTETVNQQSTAGVMSRYTNGGGSRSENRNNFDSICSRISGDSDGNGSLDGYSSVQRILANKELNNSMAFSDDGMRQVLTAIVESHLQSQQKVDQLSAALHLDLISSVELDGDARDFIKASKPISILLRKEVIRKSRDPFEDGHFAFTHNIEFLSSAEAFRSRIQTEYSKRNFQISACNQDKYEEMTLLFRDYSSDLLQINTRLFFDLEALTIPSKIQIHKYPTYTHCFEINKKTK